MRLALVRTSRLGLEGHRTAACVFYATEQSVHPLQPGPEKKLAKAAESRKTFLHNSYIEMLKKEPNMLFCQHNNLSPSDSKVVRNAFKESAQARMTVIRVGIFAHAYKVYSAFMKRQEYWERIDPNSVKASQIAKRKGRTTMDNLLVGPVCAIEFDSPTLDPPSISKALDVIRDSQGRLMLIGAKLEGKIFDSYSTGALKSLPGLSELQGQLVGLLQSPASQVSRNLTAAGGGQLSRVLDSREASQK